MSALTKEEIQASREAARIEYLETKNRASVLEDQLVKAKDGIQQCLGAMSGYDNLLRQLTEKEEAEKAKPTPTAETNA